jgi:hypothetical protein
MVLPGGAGRDFRGAVAPDGDRVEDGVTALALRLLSSEG